jgi:hypothetical protein
MLKHDVLQQLFTTSNDLADRIVSAAPATPAEVAEVNELMKRRDQVNGLVSSIIADEFVAVASTPELKQSLSELGSAVNQLIAWQNKLDGINQAVALADQVITVVLKIIELAAV